MNDIPQKPGVPRAPTPIKPMIAESTRSASTPGRQAPDEEKAAAARKAAIAAKARALESPAGKIAASKPNSSRLASSGSSRPPGAATRAGSIGKSASARGDGIAWSWLQARAYQYALLARADRPIGVALLLWPTLWALWLAKGDFPPFNTLLIFVLGVFLMRSAGCVINDYADRWLDPAVKRTQDRPIAAGRVSPREALGLFLVLIVLAFLLVLLTNKLTVQMSLVGAFLAATYPFLKRHTYLPQVYLGAAFGWSIPMAFAAVTQTLPQMCWLLFLANVLWATIYDTEYAMVDRDDDIRMGAKSTAILFADADRVILGILMAMFLLAMLLVGSRASLHWPYFAGVGVAAALFGWQQWLIRNRDRDGSFAAFRNNNWVGMALFAGLALSIAMFGAAKVV